MNRTDIAWSVALVTFVAGDLLTTLVGLELGLIERAPLYAGLSAGLIPIAFAAKLVTVAFALAAYEFLPEPMNAGIPVGLALLGTAVTAWNSYLILLVV